MPELTFIYSGIFLFLKINEYPWAKIKDKKRNAIE